MRPETLPNTSIGTFALGHSRASQPAESAPVARDTTTSRASDPAGARNWRDLLRDITAIANSGGGEIALQETFAESELRRQLEHAGFADVPVKLTNHSGGDSAIIVIGPAKSPIDFDGVAYFRHGNRSEPASASDLKSALRRLLARVRRRWLREIRRVINAPLLDLEGPALKRGIARSTLHDYANLQPVRIVTDPNAPPLHPQDVDRLYPWRQKDLIAEINSRLGRRMLNSYDIQAVRRHHRLDERPDFVFNLPGAGRRYSPAAADWMMDQYGRDPEFFRNARTADRELMKLRCHKPR